MHKKNIKLIANNLIGKTGYKLAKIDKGEYTYREDLYGKILEKYSQLLKGKILDTGSAPESWAKRELSSKAEVISFDKIGEVDVVGDLLSSPFEDNTFDCILCLETLEHVEDPFKAITELKRILKPGGALIASTPFMYELHDEHYGDYWRITRQMWKLLLKDFKDVEVDWFGKELRPHHYLVKGIK